jgi:hypothetical protein
MTSIRPNSGKTGHRGKNGESALIAIRGAVEGRATTIGRPGPLGGRIIVVNRMGHR